jgi:hypothetical protein
MSRKALWLQALLYLHTALQSGENRTSGQQLCNTVATTHAALQGGRAAQATPAQLEKIAG